MIVENPIKSVARPFCSRFFNSGKYSDFTVKTRDASYKCHRLILSQNPYFETMMGDQEHELEIRQVSTAVTELYLKFIYRCISEDDIITEITLDTLNVAIPIYGEATFFKDMSFLSFLSDMILKHAEYTIFMFDRRRSDDGQIKVVGPRIKHSDPNYERLNAPYKQACLKVINFVLDKNIILDLSVISIDAVKSLPKITMDTLVGAYIDMLSTEDSREVRRYSMQQLLRAVLIWIAFNPQTEDISAMIRIVDNQYEIGLKFLVNSCSDIDNMQLLRKIHQYCRKSGSESVSGSETEIPKNKLTGDEGISNFNHYHQLFPDLPIPDDRKEPEENAMMKSVQDMLTNIFKNIPN